MKKRFVLALAALVVLAVLWLLRAPPPAADQPPPPVSRVREPAHTAVAETKTASARQKSAATRPHGHERAPGRTDAGTVVDQPALFGKLVTLGQGLAVAEALERNAQNADRYVDRLCEETRKLRAHPAMPDNAGADRDAAEFMAPLMDYEKPLDDPPGSLHLADELRQKIIAAGPDWLARISDADLAGLDFRWMKALAQFDHWTVLSAGRLRDLPPDNLFTDPIPNYSSLMQWAKLRYALAHRRGDNAAASAEVRHLADLIRTQNILIAEAVAIVMYKVDQNARKSAMAAGADVGGWPEIDVEQLDAQRRLSFASMYFAYPGVKPETVRKAVDCMPSPCVGLFESTAVNRAVGAFGGADNLQLVSELAASHGCERGLIERLRRGRELSAAEALAAIPGGADEEIPKFLGAR